MTGEKIEENLNRLSSSGVVVSADIPEALYHIKVIENPCTLHNRDPFYIPVYPGKISLQRIKVGWIGVHRERIEANGVDFWRPVLECQRGFADKVAREDLVAGIAVKRKRGGHVVTIQSEKEHLFAFRNFKGSRLLSNLFCQLLPPGRKTKRGNAGYRDRQMVKHNDVYNGQNVKPGG